MDLIDIWSRRLWPHLATVRTPLTPADCRARLLKRLESPLADGAELTGEFWDTGGWMKLASPRTAQSTLHMTFAPHGSGTEIVCHTRGDVPQLLLGIALGAVATPVALFMLWRFFVSPPATISLETLAPVAAPVFLAVIGGFPHAYRMWTLPRRQHDGLVNVTIDAVEGEPGPSPLPTPAHQMKNIVE